MSSCNQTEHNACSGLTDSWQSLLYIAGLVKIRTMGHVLYYTTPFLHLLYSEECMSVSCGSTSNGCQQYVHVCIIIISSTMWDVHCTIHYSQVSLFTLVGYLVLSSVCMVAKHWARQLNLLRRLKCGICQLSARSIIIVDAVCFLHVPSSTWKGLQSWSRSTTWLEKCSRTNLLLSAITCQNKHQWKPKDRQHVQTTIGWFC